MDYCVICGRPKECEHHLVFGRGRRPLADNDNIKIDMCNQCHNLAAKAVDRIHGNSMAEKLSKMLGQALWERNYITETGNAAAATEAFIKRYGRNYL